MRLFKYRGNYLRIGKIFKYREIIQVSRNLGLRNDILFVYNNMKRCNCLEQDEAFTAKSV